MCSYEDQMRSDVINMIDMARARDEVKTLSPRQELNDLSYTDRML